ncbi:MAG: M48 family metallopeptidase, partial [Thermoleophilia bacterium]|nr:M48 family metallopeptidase [Thermoleophilia bacterium]
VRLVMSADGGLEVVVPRRFDQRRIPKLLESKREWIEQASARIKDRTEARRRRLEADPPRLPERIVLAGVGEEWQVEYRARTTRVGSPPGMAGSVARERPGSRLVVTGDLDDFGSCRDALCRWLSRRARRVLVPALEELALKHRFSYGRVSVRQQHSRWASCSRRNTISLNARLLFLPPGVVEHVLLHELCHTVEMNHSPRFWTLLGYHDPECHAHRKLLRAAWTAVPTWLDHEPGEALL